MVILLNGTNQGKEDGMKREIKKGITIIHIKDNGVRNKLGCPGVSRYNNTDRWRTEISIRKKKFLVGVFDDLNDAIKARKVAEIKKEAGILVQWLASRPHGNSDDYIKFWEKEFEGMDL